MNDISDEDKTGKLGELLVQLELLNHGVQASPPIYDSGNDLIAVKGEIFKAVQVKTERHDTQSWSFPDREKLYHVLALVKLHEEIGLSKVYLFRKSEVEPNRSMTELRHNLSDQYLLRNRINLFDR